MAEVVLIVATDRHGGIGRDGGLPWRNPSDLKRFKQRTMGHALVMGRKTFDSIGRPLPDRTTFVASRSAVDLEGVAVHPSPQHALEAASMAHPVVFVAGGAQIYQALARSCDAIERTIVPGDFDCDTFLPAHVFDGFDITAAEEADDLILQRWRRRR